MKETPLSLCERKFISEAVKKDKRIDGRHSFDLRTIRLFFGKDRGLCQVFHGKTKVLAQVSSEITSPKPSRPSEGIMHLNLELSPMAAPHYEAGRPSTYGVELNRLLERTLSESRCIDLESLCIVAGEKVWTIRVDVHVFDDDGSLADCASIAAITALCHYRRPAITVTAENVIVHPPEERDPVPLCVYHIPICTTFAFFDTGNSFVLSPNEVEQRVSDGKMVIGMTAHQEICSLHLSGNILLQKDQVLKCTSIASKKISDITDLIKAALKDDVEKRSSAINDSFVLKSGANSILEYERDTVMVKTSKQILEDQDYDEEPIYQPEIKHPKIISKGQGTVQYSEGPNTWEVSDNDDSEMEINIMETVKLEPKPKKPSSHSQTIETIELSEDSEEDEVVILNPEISETKTTNSDKMSRGWYSEMWPST